MRTAPYSGAGADLADILARSREEWGDGLARRYARGVADAVKRIGRHPERYPTFGSDRPGVRRLRVGRHILFFREHAAEIVVIRILHERMEHGRQS